MDNPIGFSLEQYEEAQRIIDRQIKELEDHENQTGELFPPHATIARWCSELLLNIVEDDRKIMIKSFLEFDEQGLRKVWTTMVQIVVNKSYGN